MYIIQTAIHFKISEKRTNFSCTIPVRRLILHIVQFQYKFVVYMPSAALQCCPGALNNAINSDENLGKPHRPMLRNYSSLATFLSLIAMWWKIVLKAGAGNRKARLPTVGRLNGGTASWFQEEVDRSLCRDSTLLPAVTKSYYHYQRIWCLRTVFINVRHGHQMHRLVTLRLELTLSYV